MSTDREEFKRQLMADLEEIQRLVAETKLMFAAARSQAYVPKYTIEEMEEYIQKVKEQNEAERQYRRLPWWKRLTVKSPYAV